MHNPYRNISLGKLKTLAKKGGLRLHNPTRKTIELLLRESKIYPEGYDPDNPFNGVTYIALVRLAKRKGLLSRGKRPVIEATLRAASVFPDGADIPPEERSTMDQSLAPTDEFYFI